MNDGRSNGRWMDGRMKGAMRRPACLSGKKNKNVFVDWLNVFFPLKSQ